MTRIKFKDLVKAVKGNSTVQVHCTSVNGVPATVVKGGIKLTSSSYPNKNYKYPVLINWNLPFSAPLTRLGDTKKLLLVSTRQSVIYKKMQGDNSWVGHDDKVYDNTDLVVVDTADNRKLLTEQYNRQQLKAEYLKANIGKVLTYGFELETQATDGSTRNNINRDNPEIKDRLAERMKVNGVLKTVRELDSTGDSTIKALKLWATSDILKADSFSISDKTIDHIINTAISQNIAPMSVCFNLPDCMEAGSDGSVKGFEFRTVGGLVAEKYKDAAEQIFKLNHTIDNNCSLHVHVGSDAFKLPKSRAKQQHMINYIISDDRVPASVRDRWAGAKRYFKIDTDGKTYKESFIRIHPQGTLEFRAFGNVHNAADAIECRNIAADAVAFAMAQDDTEMGDEWVSRVTEAMDNKNGKHLRNFAEYQARLRDLQAEFDRKKEQLNGSV